MINPYKVWNSNHEFGDIVIAKFESFDDAKLFVNAKAGRDGGFVSTLWVGRTFEDRQQIGVL